MSRTDASRFTEYALDWRDLSPLEHWLYCQRDPWQWWDHVEHDGCADCRRACEHVEAARLAYAQGRCLSWEYRDCPECRGAA